MEDARPPGGSSLGILVFSSHQDVEVSGECVMAKRAGVAVAAAGDAALRTLVPEEYSLGTRPSHQLAGVVEARQVTTAQAATMESMCAPSPT